MKTLKYNTEHRITFESDDGKNGFDVYKTRIGKVSVCAWDDNKGGIAFDLTKQETKDLRDTLTQLLNTMPDE